MGVHERWHALRARFYSPAELRGTGSTGADESPCGTIESVKMANGRKDLADLIRHHQRPSWSAGSQDHAGGGGELGGGLLPAPLARVERCSGYFRLLRTVGPLYFSITLVENLRRKAAFLRTAVGGGVCGGSPPINFTSEN